jgi:hypothetical protein
MPKTKERNFFLRNSGCDQKRISLWVILKLENDQFVQISQSSDKDHSIAHHAQYS